MQPTHPTRPAPVWYREPWALTLITLALPPVGFMAVAILSTWHRSFRLLLVALVLGALAVTGFMEHRFGVGADVIFDHLAQMRHLQAAGSSWPAARLELARSAFRLDPDLVYPSLAAADACSVTGRPLLARSLLAAACSGGVRARTLPAALKLSDILLEDEQMEDSWKVTRTEAILEPYRRDKLLESSDPDVLMVLARLDRLRQRPQAALYKVRRVIRGTNRPQYDQACDLHATLLAGTGQTTESLRWRAEAVRYSDRWGRPHEGLLRQSAENGWPAAPTRAYMGAVMLLQHLDAKEEGRKLLERILVLFPNFALLDEIHYLLATHHFYETEDWQAALDHYDTVVQKHPKSLTRVRCLYHAARSLEMLGRLDEAIERYARVAREAEAGHFLAATARVQIEKLRAKQQLERFLGQGRSRRDDGH